MSRLLVILCLMLMVGCTTNRPEQSSQNQHHRQIMAYPDDVGLEPED